MARSNLASATRTDPLRVMIVSARAYQAFEGGDGAHLNAFAQHLNQSFEVDGVTTSLTRGRLRPIARLVYGEWNGWRWHFRDSLAVGRWRVLVSPGGWFRLIQESWSFVRTRQRASAWTWSRERGEVVWLQDRINKSTPHVIVFAFESVAMIPYLDIPGKSMAMIGFLPHRGYGSVLGGSSANYELADSLRIGLEAADVVAVNNLSDQAWWIAEGAGRRNAVLAGMSNSDARALPDSSEQVVLFIGNKTQPNEEGLTWFLSSVWPRVLAVTPSAKLRVVGRVAEVIRGSLPNVTLVGKVDNLLGEYKKSTLVIVPLLTGSAGVKTKLVEGLSYGRSFVATSAAIEPEHSSKLLGCGRVTDNADEFADAVCEVLERSEVRLVRQAAALEIYSSLYSSSQAYRESDIWIDAAASNPSSRNNSTILEAPPIGEALLLGPR